MYPGLLYIYISLGAFISDRLLGRFVNLYRTGATKANLLLLAKYRQYLLG